MECYTNIYPYIFIKLMHICIYRYININNYHTSVASIKTLIHHSPTRRATAELHLQRRYDDSVIFKIIFISIKFFNSLLS